jgi:phage portal protein BeeE/2'-5' RNA ligase
MPLKSARHLSTLRGAVTKRATPGERIMGKLFPNRGVGFPGGWSQDRIQQVQHFTDWTYIAVHTICMKVASITPNLAWVTDGPSPGKTVKAGQRGLFNCLTGGGFGGTTHISSNTSYGTLRAPDAYVKGRRGRPDDASDWADYGGQMQMGCGGSFLTIGEYRSKALSVVKPTENLAPLESRHLMRRLVDNPNPMDTQFDYRYELMMFKLLCGVAYEWIIPNSYGKPCERWVIPSHWVWPRTGGGEWVDPEHPDADRLIQYYEVRPWGGMGSAGMLRIPASDIIPHIFKSPINKLDGYSKLWAVSRWIDTEESISKSRWSQFINQARPEFWVEMGPGFIDPDDNMIARWEAKIAQKHQGEFNYGKPLFTPAGAKVTTLSFSPTEMAYFQSEEQIRDMILSAFGVPKSAVGVVSDMTFGSVLATLMSFCEQCINPLLAQEGQVETKHLASRFDEELPAWSTLTAGGHGGSGGWRRCKLWYDNCTPADPAQVNSDLTTDMAANAITPNEVRVLRGRPPYKLGGDNPIVSGPGGLMPMPLNVQEDGDDLTDLVRQYSEALAADKDATKLGTMASNEDLPQDEVRDAGADGDGGGAGAGVAGDELDRVDRASEQMNDGGQVDEPNGRPSKRLVKSLSPQKEAFLLEAVAMGYRVTRSGDGAKIVGSYAGKPVGLVIYDDGSASPIGADLTAHSVLRSVAQMRAYLQQWSHRQQQRSLEKGILGDTVQSAGRWLANKWASLESRYGRAGALTMAVGMLATMPVPGNIALVIAAAEGIRGIHGALAGKQLKRWRAVWAKRHHDHGTTQFNLADAAEGGDAARRVLELAAAVPGEMLAAKGREGVPHVTIRYGVDVDQDGTLKQLVETFGPVKVRLGQLDYFPAEQHDMVVIKVGGERLHELNRLLAQLPHRPDDFPYNPHVTLAHVQPGIGQQAVDLLTGMTDDEQGVLDQELTFTGFVHSPRTGGGEPQYIELASFKYQEESGADSVLEEPTLEEAEARWTKALGLEVTA